jgi:hypothetical protein
VPDAAAGRCGWFRPCRGRTGRSNLELTAGTSWPAIGRFFTTHTAAGVTGLLAALAVVLLAGGYTTVRRVTA